MPKPARPRRPAGALDAAGARGAIERALKARRHYPAREAGDIAFHMTDWLEELSRFHAFCRAPGRRRPREVEELLLAFLIHVPSHLAAAARLMTGTPVGDVFEVGAVDCGHGPGAGRGSRAARRRSRS
jgi:hypothetical protein